MSSTPSTGPTDVATEVAPPVTTVGEPHRHAHAERSRLPMWAAVALTVVSGALVAVQSRINGELARRLDDFAVASIISFGSGLVILLLVTAAWPAGRRGVGRLLAALRERRIAWWMLLGGLAGAWFVATQGIAAAVLGVALFTVAVVAGQTLGGVVVDVVGIGPGGRRRLTVARGAAAILALGAVTWAVSARIETSAPLLLMVLPFSAGFAVAWQQAMNGRVRVVASSALAATLANFAVGTTALLVVLVVHATSVGWPTAMPAEAWLYAGGALGCVFIAMQAALVRRVGVLVLALGIVAGQLAAALALDLLLPTSDHGVGPATVGGTVLALAAVALSGVRGRARHASADTVRPAG